MSTPEIIPSYIKKDSFVHFTNTARAVDSCLKGRGYCPVEAGSMNYARNCIEWVKYSLGLVDDVDGRKLSSSESEQACEMATTFLVVIDQMENGNKNKGPFRRPSEELRFPLSYEKSQKILESTKTMLGKCLGVLGDVRRISKDEKSQEMGFEVRDFFGRLAEHYRSQPNGRN